MMARPCLAFGRAVRSQILRRNIAILSPPVRGLPLRTPSRISMSPAITTVGRQARAFSSSLLRARPSGTVDEELHAKLEQEIAVEADLSEHEEMPESLKEFLEHSQFKLNDKPGMEEVELVRRFGDETIRVIFSIADLNAVDEKLDDPSLYEQEDIPATPEEMEASQKRTSGGEPRSAAAPEEDEQEYDEASEPAYPARLNITIEKSKSGALQVEAIAQDGMIIVENVHYHPSVELATAQTAEADWERRGRYVGPPFGNLDEDLQVLLERYLDERGINAALSLFVPDYIDYKEQKEYVSWLKNVKSFVQA
ncbi:hypothetical protein Dda_8436 [Drechslerella dactyloides]|uniref:Mitochondrial glyco protein n=1 Tax=Drechslerella dactyloides TaxID=74499 RepID=A0AAD6IUB0_DREDA|nr:hypothetical protein Dda_8436 [Drechslerella dactyloides]